jgi:hypothetical protein
VVVSDVAEVRSVEWLAGVVGKVVVTVERAMRETRALIVKGIFVCSFGLSLRDSLCVRDENAEESAEERYENLTNSMKDHAVDCRVLAFVQFVHWRWNQGGRHSERRSNSSIPLPGC